MPDQENDLDQVIFDAIDDANPAPEPVEQDLTPTDDLETAPEAPEAPTEGIVEEAPKTKRNQWEDFDQKFGLEPTYPNSGRENRIPYSRVKKIAQKAVRDARKEWEAEFSPKYKEYETKAGTYEKELSYYKNFEKVMMTDQEKFLTMLSKVPAYQPFFSAIEEAFAAAQGQQQARGPIADGMPQPDQQLPDGSMVYSMEGLRALNAWNREQAREETLAAVQEKYGPIENEWQAHKRVEALKPVVNQQIAEARTWELFNENEAEIVKVLQQNPKISLEGAYRQVVLPKFKQDREKLVADRNKMRQELMAELQGAPRSTSVPSGSTKPGNSGEPKSLEDIIAESIAHLPR